MKRVTAILAAAAMCGVLSINLAAQSGGRQGGGQSGGRQGGQSGQGVEARARVASRADKAAQLKATKSGAKNRNVCARK
jgi:hypothetical protein